MQKLCIEVFRLETSKLSCLTRFSYTATDHVSEVPSVNFRFNRHLHSGPVYCRPTSDSECYHNYFNVNRHASAALLFKSYCRFRIAFQQNRWYADKSQDRGLRGASKENRSIVQSRENPYAHLTMGQKVKEVGKDITYLAVIIIGFAVTGLIFYVIGSELFSSESPSGVYADALKKCQNSIEVTSALGEPIKAYGETTRRGRRHHIRHTEFAVDGIPHMRMQFYIEGPNHKKATVHAEVQKDDSGKFQYRYLVVETEGYPHRTFVLEDNRQKDQLSMANI